MSQKTLLVTTLHLASDTISLDYNSASRKLFIPPTTNYQLKWCFSASYNLSLKINFAWILQVCLQHAELNAPAPSHPRAKIKAVGRMSLVRSLFITTGRYFSSGIKNAVSGYFSVPKRSVDVTLDIIWHHARCQWEVQHVSPDPTSKFIHGPGSKKHYQDIIILPTPSSSQ